MGSGTDRQASGLPEQEAERLHPAHGEGADELEVVGDDKLSKPTTVTHFCEAPSPKVP